MCKNSTKSKSKYRMPGKLWRFLKKHLPKEPKVRKPGRPRVNNRDVLDGIWYVLWTGCHTKISMSLWVCKTILRTSNIDEEEMSPKMSALFLEKRAFLPAVGSLKEPSVGYQNGGVSLLAGAKNLKIGLLLFTWLVRKSCSR